METTQTPRFALADDSAAAILGFRIIDTTNPGYWVYANASKRQTTQMLNDLNAGLRTDLVKNA